MKGNMSNKIYKYEIQIADTQQIDIPLDWSVMRVGLDPNNIPCIWADVNPDDENIPTTIYVVGTGHPLPVNAEHLGSFIQGPFVWHVLAKSN